MKKYFFDQVVEDSTSKFNKIKKEDYLLTGQYQIVDQGKEFVAGYTNDRELVSELSSPVIVFGDHTKVFKYIDFPLALGADGVKVLTVRNNLADSKYLYYYFKTLNLTDAGYSRHFKFLKEVSIPLPEKYDDQIRIAAILTRAENLIAKRKESIKALDEFLKCTFLEMFGDPVRNENGWEEKTAIDFAGCIVPGRDKPKSFTGYTPWVTTDDLVHLGFTEKSKSGIGLSDEEIKEVRARVIPKGSVIITCVGDLGVVTIAKVDMVVNQQLHTFQCNLVINNIYFMHAISYQKAFMYKRATMTTVPYMNKTVCNSIPLMCPPLSLQNKFAAIVEKIESMKVKYNESLVEMEKLYGGLSQRAFRGEL